MAYRFETRADDLIQLLSTENDKVIPEAALAAPTDAAASTDTKVQ